MVYFIYSSHKDINKIAWPDGSLILIGKAYIHNNEKLKRKLDVLAPVSIKVKWCHAASKYNKWRKLFSKAYRRF